MKLSGGMLSNNFKLLSNTFSRLLLTLCIMAFITGMYQIREANQMVEEFMLAANVSVAEKILQLFPVCSLLRYAGLSSIMSDFRKLSNDIELCLSVNDCMMFNFLLYSTGAIQFQLGRCLNHCYVRLLQLVSVWMSRHQKP